MRITRVEPVDRLDREGESLLLYERQVVRLGPIGTAIFDRTAVPRDLAELAEALAEEFGPPATGTLIEVTRAAVADLIGQQVLMDADAPPEDRQEDSHG